MRVCVTYVYLYSLILLLNTVNNRKTSCKWDFCPENWVLNMCVEGSPHVSSLTSCSPRLSSKRQTQVTMKRQTEKMNWWRYESLQSYSVTLCASSSFLSISWWQEEEVFKLSSSTDKNPEDLYSCLACALLFVMFLLSLASSLSCLHEWVRHKFKFGNQKFSSFFLVIFIG